MHKKINVVEEYQDVISHQGSEDRKLKNFIFPTAIDESENKIISNVHAYDFHVVAITADKNTPQFFYTIGLYYQYQHPELLIIGLDVKVAHAILMSAYEFIKNGGCIAPWTNNLKLSNLPFKAVPIHPRNYSEFLGFGMWFYRSLQSPVPDLFPTIQLHSPDFIMEPVQNKEICLSA